VRACRLRVPLLRAIALLGLASAALPVRAQTDLETLLVQGSVFALMTPGGNTTVQTGAEGPLIVDTQPAALSESVLGAVRRLTPRPIRHIVLTSSGDQNAGGAANLSKAGRYVRLIDSVDPRGLDTRASIIAHLNVLNRMTASRVPSASWPTDTYFTAEWSLFSNGEAVQFVHVADAHSDGDTIVFFRRSDVISTGAIFDTDSYPRFDAAAGGSIAGIIEGLNRVLDIAVPGENQEGGTVIVPGHGRLADETDVANYRDMVTIVRDRVQAMAKKGLTLDQVKAARPTLDFETRYGAATGPWTTAMFVEAVYRGVR
jgi:cyclase